MTSKRSNHNFKSKFEFIDPKNLHLDMLHGSICVLDLWPLKRPPAASDIKRLQKTIPNLKFKVFDPKIAKNHLK